MDLIKTIHNEFFTEEYKPLPDSNSSLIFERSNDFKKPYTFGFLKREEQLKQDFKLLKVDNDLILCIYKDFTNLTYHLKSTGLMSVFQVNTLSIPTFCNGGVFTDASVISHTIVLLFVHEINACNYVVKYSFEGNGYAFLSSKIITFNELPLIGHGITIKLGNDVNMLMLLWNNQKLFTINHDNENQRYVVKCIADNLGGNNFAYEDQTWFVNNKQQVANEKYHDLDLNVKNIISIIKVDYRWCLLFCLEFVNGEYGVLFFDLANSRFELPMVLQTKERINYAFVSSGMICIMFDNRYYIKRSH